MHFVTLSTGAIGNTRAGSAYPTSCTTRAKVMAGRARARDYVLAAMKELHTLGIRDAELQRLAEQLKGIHRSACRLSQRVFFIAARNSWFAPLLWPARQPFSNAPQPQVGAVAISMSF